MFDGNEIRGLEQNPETKSQWAQLARSGKRVMQAVPQRGPLRGKRRGWQGDSLRWATVTLLLLPRARLHLTDETGNDVTLSWLQP